MSTHDTDVEIDIDSLLDDGPSEDAAALAPIQSEVKETSHDIANMLRRFIHGDRATLEEEVNSVVEQNESMRKKIAEAARKRRTTKAVEVDPEEDQDADREVNDLDSDLLGDDPHSEEAAPAIKSIYPERNLTVVRESMELNGQVFPFQSVSTLDAAKAPSFLRSCGLMRLSPTFKSLSTHDMEEGVSPFARVGFLPISGPLAMMRDSQWPEFRAESMECSSPSTQNIVNQRIDYVHAFMEQNNAKTFEGAEILNAWQKYSRVDKAHIAVTDDATYCLFEAKNMLGHSHAHTRSPEQDGRSNYPYHRTNPHEINIHIGPNEGYPVMMLFAFSGGKDYLRALIQKENSNLLTAAEVEEKLNVRLNTITQETMQSFINDTRSAHGSESGFDPYDISERERNSDFLRTVANNSGTTEGSTIAPGINSNHATCLAILESFPSTHSELDISGGKMTVTRKERSNMNDDNEEGGSRKLMVDLVETLTFNSNRFDKVTGLTDIVVAARGIARLQTQLAPDAPISFSNRNARVVMEQARDMTYKLSRSLRWLSYEVRNYKAISEAYRLHGGYAKVKRDNQTYTIMRTQEDNSEEMAERLRQCFSSAQIHILVINEILLRSDDREITENSNIQSYPLTILLEDALVREGVGLLMDQNPDECCVLSTVERGENTLLISEVAEVLHGIKNEITQKIMPPVEGLFPVAANVAQMENNEPEASCAPSMTSF